MLRVYKILPAILLPTLLWRTITLSEEKKVVQVVINIPAHSPANSKIFLTGSKDIGCAWQPDCIPLRVVNAAGLSFGVFLEVSAHVRSLKLKVSRGSWDNEAADSDGYPLSNQTIGVEARSSTHVLSVVTWKDLGGLGVTGDVRDLGRIYSPQLKNSRAVRIWLPPSYSIGNLQRYPVIYMHDGQNVFDPKTSTFGVDWDVDNTMTRISRESGLEAIVVGVESSRAHVTRAREYDMAYDGELYADFLIDTLKPLVDAKFRTRPERESTFTAGSSMGAIISVELVWAHPEVFSKALGFSLPADVHDYSILRLINEVPRPSQPIKIYLDHGDWGGDRGYKIAVLNFVKGLEARGLDPQDILYAQFPFHDHTEADWARRLERPLTWLLR